MNNNRKKIFSRIAFFLNGFLFLFGAISLIYETKYVFGLIQLLAAIFNLSMLIKFKNQKIIRILSHAILIMNIIVSLSIAFDFYSSGKTYIQYAWVLAALISLIALITQIKKNNNTD